MIAGILLLWPIDSQDLGGGYYFLPQEEAIDVGFPGGAVIYKGPRKYVFNEVLLEGDIGEVYKGNAVVLVSTGVNSLGEMSYFVIHKSLDSLLGPFDKEACLELDKEWIGIDDWHLIQQKLN